MLLRVAGRSAGDAVMEFDQHLARGVDASAGDQRLEQRVFGTFHVQLEHVALGSSGAGQQAVEIDGLRLDALATLDVFVGGIEAAGNSVGTFWQLVLDARQVKDDGFTGSGPEGIRQYFHARRTVRATVGEAARIRIERRSLRTGKALQEGSGETDVFAEAAVN